MSRARRHAAKAMHIWCSLSVISFLPQITASSSVGAPLPHFCACDVGWVVAQWFGVRAGCYRATSAASLVASSLVCRPQYHSVNHMYTSSAVCACALVCLYVCVCVLLCVVCVCVYVCVSGCYCECVCLCVCFCVCVLLCACVCV